MIECYKCEWSQLMNFGEKNFKLCCNRFRDIIDLDCIIPACKEYKERPAIDW